MLDHATAQHRLFQAGAVNHRDAPTLRTLGLRTPMAKEMLQRQIDATDGQNDRLVHELYGLTEEEIGIVEEAKA